MAFDRATLEADVIALVQDDGGFIIGSELDVAVETALQRLNIDSPQTLSKDITGDGTRDYDLPDEYVKGFSEILTVEVPAGETPMELKDRNDDWFIYEDPTKAAAEQLRLRFIETTPSSTETIRIVLTTPHVLTDTQSTLNQTTFLAVKYMTLCLYFRALGARFGQTTDSTIAADAVDYGGRTQNFLFLAERYQTSYNNILGLNAKTKPAQVLGDADIRFNHEEDFLWHPARQR